MQKCMVGADKHMAAGEGVNVWLITFIFTREWGSTRGKI